MRKFVLVFLIAALCVCLFTLVGETTGFLPAPKKMVEPSPTPTPTPTPEPTPTPTPPPTPEPTPTPEPVPVEAEEVSLRFACEGIAKEELDTLRDGDHRTLALFFGETRELQIASDGAFKSLYIVWDDIPAPYRVVWDGGELSGGQNDFLHEYVELPESVSALTIELPEGGIGICEITALTDGVLPAWVQVWQPPCETADILLFPTHADDELLFFGGILPTYAGERGLNVQVVYMTCHFFGIEKFRCHEQLNGLWAAGETHYPVIHMQEDIDRPTMDKAMSMYAENFHAFQVEQIRRFKPLVIVGHDEAGEYGNRVHRVNTYCLELSVEDAAASWCYPESAEKYGVWDTPKTYLHLYGDGEIVLNFETPLKHFDGATAFEVAQEAYACHLSQQHWSFHVYDYGEEWDCHRFGLYRSTVGEDVLKNDLLENTEGIR